MFPVRYSIGCLIAADNYATLYESVPAAALLPVEPWNNMPETSRDTVTTLPLRARADTFLALRRALTNWIA